MPYHATTRKFTIEIEVHTTVHTETGGGYADEPPWAEIADIEIDQVDVGDNTVISIGHTMKLALRDAAYKEFSE